MSDIFDDDEDFDYIFNQPITGISLEDQNAALKKRIISLNAAINELAGQLLNITHENITLKNNINAYIEKRRDEILNSKGEQ